VWPDREPETDGYTFIRLDDTPWEPLTVEAGTQFLVIMKEKDNFPNGFAWMEPVHEFACATVVSKNYGEFNTGYQIWLLAAKGEVCTETVPLVRPAWWTGEEMQAELTLNVVPISCE